MTPTQDKTAQVSTPTDSTIVITRNFNAPLRMVWEAMFTPARMRRWMIPPPGWTLTSMECEPRLGGALKLAWKSADGDQVMTLQGTFTEVVHHERIVHTEKMALGTGQVVGELTETHAFMEKDGVTTMRITQSYPSKVSRDEAMASGMDDGMEACYQQLDTLLAEGASRTTAAAAVR